MRRGVNVFFACLTAGFLVFDAMSGNLGWVTVWTILLAINFYAAVAGA